MLAMTRKMLQWLHKYGDQLQDIDYFDSADDCCQNGQTTSTHDVINNVSSDDRHDRCIGAVNLGLEPDTADKINHSSNPYIKI